MDRKLMDDRLYNHLQRNQVLQQMTNEQLLYEQAKLRQQQERLVQQQQQLDQQRVQQRRWMSDPQGLSAAGVRSASSRNTRWHPIGASSEELREFPHLENESESMSLSILNSYNRNNSSIWLENMFRDVTSAPVGKQVAIGGISGWCSGFLLTKVGKAAALAVGGSLLIVQVAHWQGLIQINWSNIERSVAATRNNIANRVSNNAPQLADQVREFAQRHAFLAGSFGVGFLLAVTL